MMKLSKIAVHSFLTLALITHFTQAAFVDVSSTNEYSAAINYVQSEGIVSGYPDGTFKPGNTINRAEFTKIVVEAIAGSSYGTGSGCFSDVSSEWFAPYVCYAKAEGIIGGYPDGSFKPGNSINFVEAAKIIGESFGAIGVEIETELWFEAYIDGLAAKNAIPVGITGFTHSVTRAEMAEIVYRLRSNNMVKTSHSFATLNGDTQLGINVESSATLESDLDTMFTEIEADFEAEMDLNIDLSDIEAADPEPSPDPVVTEPAVPPRKYADGVYMAEGSYRSPGGNDVIQVELVIESDLVTAVALSEVQVSDVSRYYVGEYAKGIEVEVVGKSLEGLSGPQKLNGSSLTSVGFNEALMKIKAEAEL